jgi:multicomponent Na+:H+ antiporter subunit D
MIGDVPAGLILVAAGLALPLAPRRARPVIALLAPILAFAQILWVGAGHRVEVEAFGLTLEIVRTDKLSLAFGYVFSIAAFLNALFSWHERDGIGQPAALVYAGSALCAVFAGDLLTLFVFWEVSAVASALVVWGGAAPRAFGAGMRYLIVQLAAGMLLAAGAVLHRADTGSLAFDYIGLGTAAGVLIFLAAGIKCAFPLLHNWLQDAYPEASATGTVVLSAFTTKLGIYALARGFPGTELLIWIGAAMAAFPIFYAVIENDLRRVLAYSLNNQLGFMVVGIGLGTDLALNGAVAHAFADILFKGLLFMSMGAVLFRTGTVRATDLGGLYKSMPWTAGFCMVGAASISAFPLFSGFVTKSMIMAAAAHEGHYAVWLVLLFASAGVFHHAGIKIPFFAFFSHDAGLRVREAPVHMLLAMAIAAALCIAIGTFPALFYSLLPYPVDYVPYTPSHVLSQLQLLVFSALAFSWLMRNGIYPPELRSTNLDADWLYRRASPRILGIIERWAVGPLQAFAGASGRVWGGVRGSVRRHHAPGGALARTWSLSASALWVLVLLLGLLLAGYVTIR